MKQAWMTAGLLAFTFSGGLAQNNTKSEPVRESVFTVTERGAHHKVWERIEYESGPDGMEFPRRHAYTELATGMHFKNAQGEWEESKEEIEILPNNAGAIANKGPHKVIFPPEIKSGLIELQTPDQKWMRSRVWGLAYFDVSTGESVLLAEVKESEGQLVGNNVIVYPNAFTDFVADIRYTYTLAGFEQDVVLRENPPTPEEFGLDPETTRLQVLTEFVEAEVPVKTKRMAGKLADEALDFGSMQIGLGKAFAIDAAGAVGGPVPVVKEWGQIEGRNFLVEEAAYRKIVKQLKLLPAAKKYEGSSLLRRGNGEGVLVGLRALVPKRYAKTAPDPLIKSKRMAKAKQDHAPGFVMDYSILSSQTDFTFKGDTTYYCTNVVALDGTIIIEGGTVIKFSTNLSAQILLMGAGPDPVLICKAEPYRMAVFTAKDDNSVGETIAGSSGNPSGYYGGIGLRLWPTHTVKNLRMLYLTSVFDDSEGGENHFQNIQIIKCKNAFIGGEGSQITVENGLIEETKNVTFNAASWKFTGTHLTVNRCDIFAGSVDTDPEWSSTFNLTNSLLVSVTNWTDNSYVGFNSNATVYLLTDNGVFQTVGGGAHYLTTNSPYRNVGTTNIDATLLASLTRKTTYPPIAYTNVTFTAPTTFNPQAQRDTDTPDLGYHYDPLDYALGGCAASANLTFAAGTAVGWFRTTSGWQYAGQAIRMIGNIVVSFEGTATAPTYFVRLNTVQENDRTAGYGHGGIENWEGPAYPTVRGRFLRCTAMAGEVFNGYFADDYGGIRAEMTHTEFWSGSLQTYGDYMYYTNCLMWRLGFVGMVAGGSDSVFVMRNCTMIGGRLEMQRNGPSPVLVLDGAFDGTTISMADSYGSNPSYTTCDYNAYTNTSNPFPIGGTHNVPVSSSFNWQTGPLGNYYLPTNSTLINTGSVTAPNIALYHFTTQTNQTKEATSQVDIGYHYVAVDGNGIPIDTDGDGIPDYQEDGDGDGAVDSGETDPNNSTDLGLKVWITRPKQNAILP